jgi:hypothetical protein
MNTPSVMPPAIEIESPTINLHILVAIPRNKLPSAAPYARSSATCIGDGNMFSDQIFNEKTICQTTIIPA